MDVTERSRVFLSLHLAGTDQEPRGVVHATTELPASIQQPAISSPFNGPLRCKCTGKEHVGVREHLLLARLRIAADDERVRAADHQHPAGGGATIREGSAAQDMGAGWEFEAPKRFRSEESCEPCFFHGGDGVIVETSKLFTPRR